MPCCLATKPAAGRREAFPSKLALALLQRLALEQLNTLGGAEVGGDGVDLGLDRQVEELVADLEGEPAEDGLVHLGRSDLGDKGARVTEGTWAAWRVDQPNTSFLFFF